jgi:DNA invertase Pin-like site-specific DNA recombinase
MADSFIAYRRASTKKQTIGLEIQRAGVEDYIQRNGGELIAWYEDVGAAAKSAGDLSKAQPNLVRALAHSLNVQATLIVARLDRLTRSTAVLALTLEDGPPLLVVETPDASPFILQIYAAVA